MSLTLCIAFFGFFLRFICGVYVIECKLVELDCFGIRISEV